MASTRAALLNWRPGGLWQIAPEVVRRFVADTLVPRLPGSRCALRDAIVPRDAAHARGDVLRQLRRGRTAPPGDAAATRGWRGWRRRIRPTPRRAPTSTRRHGAARTLDRLLYTDIKTYLDELLMKQDQMSMAASIESRVPFLDHHLVEFATALRAAHEAAGPDHEVDPAAGGPGTPAPRDPQSTARWASRCRSRSGCAAPGRTSRAMCSSTAARASAVSSIIGRSRS